LKNGTAKRASFLCSKLEKEYPDLIEAHKEIRKYLEQLKKVGSEEGHLTAVRFAEKLEKHSREEEELLYPAALLAGKASLRARTKG
jgi:hypothetical protein